MLGSQQLKESPISCKNANNFSYFANELNQLYKKLYLQNWPHYGFNN
jgi:hypothetical protein